jgi:hypothetical protein
MMLILGLLFGPDPGIHSSVTWKVRQKSTGVIKRVTADGESEAVEKIANRWFDSD